MTVPRRASRCLLAVVLVLAAVVAVPAATRSARAGAVDLSGQPVMGPSRLTGAQLARFFRANTRSAYRASVPIDVLAQLFVDEGNAENVRGDVAFAQSILETGWFSFPDGGFVRPEFNNFAGMGACGGCIVVTEPTAQLGVRAQIQHLRSYADPTSRTANLHHPLVDSYGNAHAYDTFQRKGWAPTWSQMGNGNWATDPNYAVKVLGIYNRMLISAGLPGQCPPDALGLGQPDFARGCPNALRSPGRAIAGNPTGGYYVLNGDGHVYAFGGATYYGSPAFTFEIARDVAVMPDGHGYVVLDGWGGVHRFGSAASLPLPSTYWHGWDIARSVAITADGHGVVVLDGWGGVHTSGSAAHLPLPSTYWRGWDIARRVQLSAADGVHTDSVYVLDGWGSVHQSGPAPRLRAAAYWKGWDIARGLAVRPRGGGYGVLDGWGVVHGTGSMGGRTFPGSARADRFRGITLVPGGYEALRNDAFAAH